MYSNLVLNINMVVYLPDVSESTFAMVVDLLALDMCHLGIAQKECCCKECHLGQVLKLGMSHQNCKVKSIDSHPDRHRGILFGEVCILYKFIVRIRYNFRCSPLFRDFSAYSRNANM